MGAIKDSSAGPRASLWVPAWNKHPVLSQLRPTDAAPLLPSLPKRQMFCSTGDVSRLLSSCRIAGSDARDATALRTTPGLFCSSLRVALRR